MTPVIDQNIAAGEEPTPPLAKRGAKATAHADPARCRKALALAAGLTAVGAWGGAAGLAAGTIDLGPKLTGRLPLASPVLGAVALAAIVAAPFTVLVLLAWRADDRAGLTAFAAGVLLMGWIVVELAFIRAASFLDPLYFLVGALFVWVARHDIRQTLDWARLRDDPAAESSFASDEVNEASDEVNEASDEVKEAFETIEKG